MDNGQAFRTNRNASLQSRDYLVNFTKINTQCTACLRRQKVKTLANSVFSRTNFNNRKQPGSRHWKYFRFCIVPDAVARATVGVILVGHPVEVRTGANTVIRSRAWEKTTTITQVFTLIFIVFCVFVLAISGLTLTLSVNESLNMTAITVKFN